MRALIAALAFVVLPTAAFAATPDANTCATQIKAQTAHGRPANPGCWHIGPLELGMTPDEVAAIIGPADHEAPGPADALHSKVDRAGYRDAVYLFPRGLAQDLAREPQAGLSMRVLTVSYFQGHAVRIDTRSPVSMETGDAACATRRDLQAKGEPESFAPFRSFAGVREGDRKTLLIRRFGQPMTTNRPGDFLTYMPTPLTVDIDLDHKAVGGFTIGVDTDAVFLGGVVRLALTRDPATCRVTGLSFREEPANAP